MNELLLNFAAELGASLAMAALGWVGKMWRPSPEASALQHAYSSGIAAMLQTFPAQNDLEYIHYQSLLHQYFERDAVQTELNKLIQPNHFPVIETLVAELREAVYMPIDLPFEPEKAIHALLQGFELGAYDSEEFRSRLALRQLARIGQHHTQQTNLLEAIAVDIRRLSQSMMDRTFVPDAPSANQIVISEKRELAISPALKHLSRQVRAGKVVLFVGAGVSREAGLPSGWELAELLAADLGYSPRPGDSLGTIAEYYQQELSRATLIDRLLEWLDVDVELGPSHQLIPQFDWRAIFTTNYDQLLEKGFYKLGKPHHKILYNQQFFDLSVNSLPIVKLHGCLSHAHRRSREAPIVITDADYEEYGPRRESLQGKLKQLLMEGNTLLFLGYGLRDRLWQDLRKEVATVLQEHTRAYYAVMPHFTSQWAAYWQMRKVHLIASTAHTFLQQLINLSAL